MKAIVIFVFALSCFATSSFCQEVEMIVYMEDGTNLTMNIDSIDEMLGTGVEYPWTRLVEIDLYMYGFSWPLTSLGFTRTDNSVLLGGLIVSSPTQGWQTIEAIHFPLTSQGSNIQGISDIENEERMAVWHDSTIYGSSVCKKFEHNLGQKTVREIKDVGGWLNMELNDKGDRMAFSQYLNECWPIGDPNRLLEFDLKTEVMESLPSFGVVTSARYVPGTNDLIYYSRGSFTFDNPRPADAGYYYLPHDADSSTLILSHPSGVGESVNGFDISHDGKKLLVPSAKNDGRTVVFEYNIETKERDTIDSFKDQWSYGLPWLQYSSDDSLILYSFGMRTGIVERQTGLQTIVHLAPSNARPYYIPFPRWSPDDTAICYGAAMIPEYVQHSVEAYQLYIKKLEP